MECVFTRTLIVNPNQKELVGLDVAAGDYVLTHNVGHQVAYDTILATSEGMELRSKYDASWGLGLGI